jgi:hypothetical protein
MELEQLLWQLRWPFGHMETFEQWHTNLEGTLKRKLGITDGSRNFCR